MKYKDLVVIEPANDISEWWQMCSHLLQPCEENARATNAREIEPIAYIFQKEILKLLLGKN